MLYRLSFDSNNVCYASLILVMKRKLTDIYIYIPADKAHVCITRKLIKIYRCALSAAHSAEVAFWQTLTKLFSEFQVVSQFPITAIFVLYILNLKSSQILVMFRGEK